MDKKILIIIPVFNEEKNIARVINEIQEDLDSMDVLIINDSSKDNTLSEIKKTKCKYLTLPINLGYSGALQTGFKYAVENNYDFVVQFDGDGQHIAKEVNKLIDKHKETGADIVIGSRFLGKREYKHPFFRNIGTKIFVLFILLIHRMRLTDPTSGFQLLNRRTFSRYAKIYHFPQFPDANLVIEMLFFDYKITEVAIKMRSREDGLSMHSGIIKPIKYMIKTSYGIFMILLKYVPKRIIMMFKKTNTG